jgi:acetyl-CoA carboxylase carboxyltransferase component
MGVRGRARRCAGSLAGVLSIVRCAAAERAGQEFNEATDQMMRKMVEDQIGKESYAFFATARVRIAVMGPEQLAGVLSIVQRTAAERAGQDFDEATDQMMRKMVEDQIGKESYAFFATARVWDDGIIDPRDTRTVLGLCLSAVHSNVIQGTTRYGVFRM